MMDSYFLFYLSREIHISYTTLYYFLLTFYIPFLGGQRCLVYVAPFSNRLKISETAVNNLLPSRYFFSSRRLFSLAVLVCMHWRCSLCVIVINCTVFRRCNHSLIHSLIRSDAPLECFIGNGIWEPIKTWMHSLSSEIFSLFQFRFNFPLCLLHLRDKQHCTDFEKVFFRLNLLNVVYTGTETNTCTHTGHITSK